MKQAFTFPGQGSQAVGMGQALAAQFTEARDVFAEIDDALGQNLSHIMWEGAEETLRLTENAQPALMAVSMAIIRVLQARGFSLETQVAYIAGHSLGEYTALAAGGTFSLADAARLLKIRGQAMQEAVPLGQGSMAAILGLDFAHVAELAAQASTDDNICTAANDNAPGQIVISGTKAGVDKACDLAKQAGAKRAMPLPVSAPFHCSLMAPAAEIMADALANVEMKPPTIPLVANVTARANMDKEANIDMIRRQLIEQVTGIVRWRESIMWLAAQGVTQFVEIGSGKVLTGLAKRINKIDKQVNALALNEGEDIQAYLDMNERDA